MKKDKWIAYYSADGIYEEFSTFAEAEKWLKCLYKESLVSDGCFYPDSVDGCDYIARITHRSKYVVSETKEDYPCRPGVHSYCDGCGWDCPEECPHENPWPYNDDFDEVGDMEFEEVSTDLHINTKDTK